MPMHEAQLRADRAMVEARLSALLPDTGRLTEAMRYSLLNGGKRVRAVLALEFCRSLCGSAEPALDAACAIEMLHSYTLIHDDLPCMDDDALRRGKPTSHVVYGEWLALLAGDALQAEAFRVLLESDLPAESRAEAARLLAHAAGCRGICQGQYLDLAAEGRQLGREELDELNAGKTAALLEAACAIGCVAAGAPQHTAAAAAFGRHLGLAFQAKDDLLDEQSSPEVLGKPIGSDARNGKNTLVRLLGAAGCEALVREESRQAAALLREGFPDPAFLLWFTQALVAREN